MSVMSKRYYSLDGELIGERSGGFRTDYLRDALGSVTATKRTDRGTISNTYRYKPYGERLAKTGVAADPRFQWVGTAGYRETSISHSKSYVRRRHLGQEEGRWTTVDPLWPSEPNYGNVNESPCMRVDPSGLGCGENAIAGARLECYYQRNRYDKCCDNCGSYCFCSGQVHYALDVVLNVGSSGNTIVDKINGLNCSQRVTLKCDYWKVRRRSCPPGTRCKEYAGQCDCKGTAHRSVTGSMSYEYAGIVYRVKYTWHGTATWNGVMGINVCDAC